MTHIELSQVIHEYFKELYKKEYVGRLKIEDLHPVGYKVSFYLGNIEYPLVIAADLPDEEFLPFIKEEIRSRKLHRVKHYRTTYDGSRINRQNRRSHCGSCL